MAAKRSQDVLVYGSHAVGAILRSHPELIYELVVDKASKSSGRQALIERAQQLKLRLQFADKQLFKQHFAGLNHQGLIARCQQWPEYSYDDLLNLLKQLEQPPLLLILDGVQDPHNLGACLRTADAAGVDAVIIPKDGAVGITATVAKVAAGAVGAIPLVRVANLARCLRALQEHGIWLVGTDAEAEQDLFEMNLSGALGLVMGAEGVGLRRLTKETCDSLVSIPMRGSVASLNVSVAAGVCIYEINRQRRMGGN